MRAKSRRLLLLLVVLVTVGGGIAVYSHGQRGRDAAARVARVEGLAAFDRGEYAVAMAKLGQFIRRMEPDAEALLRYAQSARRLPGADAQHLASAEVALRRCVGLDSNDAAARAELLDVFLQTGARGEVLEQADWFLARDPNDSRAVRAKAFTLAEMKRYEDALALLESRVPPEAPRLEEHLLHLTLLARLERTAADIHAYARKVVATQLADPRHQLLAARASLLTQDALGARGILIPLVPLAKGDAPFARLLLEHLDEAGLPQESLRVLTGFAPNELDDTLRGDLVRRLWESSEPGRVVDHIASWRIDRSELPSTVLGYELLSLGRLRRLDEARAPLEALKTRKSERVARGWVSFLGGVILADAPSVAMRLAACLRAIEADPSNSVAQHELGLAYRDAGEIELATRAFRAAANLARSWSEPVAAGARLLAESGRLRPALQAATEARARSSDDPGVALLLAVAQGAASGPPGGGLPDRVLAALVEVDLPPADVLPIRLSVLASAGRFAEVRELIVQLLQPGVRAEGPVLLACALLSQVKAMGLDARCFERYEELHGSTPALALALARNVARTDGPDAGFALLRERSESARANGPKGGAGSWWAAEGTYLESSGRRDEALHSWKQAARDAPGDLTLLRTILDAAVPWDDRELTRSAIDALKAGTGPTCLAWRYFDARWLLARPTPDTTAQEGAIAHLRAILAQAPEQARARLLLARIHEVRGEASLALEQLMVARGVLGTSVALELRIARLQIAASDWMAARDTLQRVLAPGSSGGSSPLSAGDRLAMAAMFARLGERKSVLALLGQDSTDPADASEAAGRAELFAAAGELGKAESLVGAVLATKESPRAVLLAAALAEFGGREQEAEALLGRLDLLVPDVAERLRERAEHYLRVGRLERAEEQQRRVIELPGAAPGDWISLLSSLVAQGKVAEVVATLERARRQGVVLTADREAALSVEVLRSAAARPELRGLGMTYLQDRPHRAVAEQALRVLSQLGGGVATPSELARLRLLAQQAPRFLALQLAVVDVLMRSRDFEGALLLLQSASVAFPMAPEPPRAIAFCQRALGRRERAAEAAKRWRERVAGAPLEPDLFLAQQSSPEEAATLLEPHIQVAIARGMPELLEKFGQSLILSGEVGRLTEALEPALAAGDKTVATAWGGLAGFLAARGETALAAEWLQRDAAQSAVVKSVSVRVRMASAWIVLADVSGSAQARDTAKALVKDIPHTSGLGTKEWELLGQIYEATEQTSHAEQAYRKATGVSPPSLVALNNLAALLARSGRVDEALPLAKELVAGRPDVAEYHDTLATVQARAGAVEAALESLEQSRRIEPGNARWAVRIVRMMIERGDREGAARRLHELRPLYAEENMSPETRAAWGELTRVLGEGSGAGG